MKGLLMKDLYVLSGQMRYFILLALVFAVIPSESLGGFAIVYAAMLPYSSISYDERSKWDQLAGMMPYSVRQIVGSKFLLGYLCVGAVTLISFLARRLLPGSGGASLSLLTMAGIALLMLAVTLPFMLRFGVERGRMIFTLIMVGLACGSMTTIQILNEDGVLSSFWTLGVPLAALAANLIAVPLSIRAYARRTS